MSREVIQVLDIKIVQLKEKINGQKVLITELENVIEELTDTMTRDMLIQQKAKAPKLSKIIRNGDSIRKGDSRESIIHESRDSEDLVPEISSKFRVIANKIDNKRESKRMKSAEKSKSASINILDRRRSKSITNQVD